MTNPKPGDLAIFVRAENVLLECGRLCECFGAGGHRKGTLEGWCKLDLSLCDHGFIMTQKGADRWVADTIKHLHDDTCPDEIRAQLHEVIK